MHGIRIVLCGPPLVRHRIRRHFETITPDARVVGEAPSPEAAALLTRRFAPHLVIVADTGEEEPDYREIVQEIRKATPQRTYVVLLPKEAIDDEIPGVAAILPRSRYTNRALVSAFERLISRL